jgi:DNA invertase Pin-like site-specific DNA recombinase
LSLYFFTGNRFPNAEYDSVEQQHRTRSERIKAGLESAKRKPGREVGQVDKLTDDLKKDIALYLEDGSMLMVELMDRHGVSRNTLKKYIDIVKSKTIE